VQVTNNESFIKRRARIGALGTLGGFAVLGLGMYVSLQQPQRPEQFLIPWVTLALGIILLQVGKYHATRYGTRTDRALVQALKGFDNRYHLFNFVSDLPVEHLLVTPSAVVVLETRQFYGDVVNEGGRWSRPRSAGALFQLFTDGGLGNPTREAQRDAVAVQNMLRERLGDAVSESIAVVPMIVFTNPRAKLRVSDPDVPVVQLPDLRTTLRSKLKEGGKLRSDVQRQLARALPAGS